MSVSSGFHDNITSDKKLLGDKLAKSADKIHGKIEQFQIEQLEHGQCDNDNESIPCLDNFSRFGPYTLFIIVLYIFQLVPMFGNMTFMVYGGVAPQLDSCGNFTFSSNKSSLEQCEILTVLQLNNSCNDPVIRAQFRSVAYEFGYFCERISWVKNSISMQIFAIVCGVILFGQLSDWFGRKRMMLIAQAGQCLCCLAASISSTLFQFTAFQSASMLFFGGLSTMVFVFLLENLSISSRLLVMNVFSASPIVAAFAGIAYLVGDWRRLLQAIALLQLPSLALLPFAFESPKWLLAKGRWTQARRVLTKIERIDGGRRKNSGRNRRESEDFDRDQQQRRSEQIEQLIQWEQEDHERGSRTRRKYNYMHLFCTWRLLSYTTVLSYGLMSHSVFSYAVFYNMDTLSGSIYWNMAIFGALRYLLNLTVAGFYHLSPRTGRNKPVYLVCTALVIAMIGAVFVAKLRNWDAPMLERVLLIASIVLISQLFVVGQMACNELYPTPIRNIGSSFVQMFNKGGGVLSPYVFSLAFHWPPLPFLIMLVLLSLNLFLFAVFIPEPNDTNSPQNNQMPEPEEWIF